MSFVDDTLRDGLAEVLATCTCTPHPYGDGPQIDCPRHGHEKHQADALLPRIREHVAKAEAEVQRLTDWKESAMTVMSGLQDVGKELGLPLGEPVTGTLAAEIAHRLRTRAETAEAAIDRAKAVCDAVTYKVPGDSDSYGAYPEGRSDLAGEVLAALEPEATP